MIGDARFLPIKNESVNCVVTSPPYWGLRKYDIPDLIWDGDGGCKHKWIDKGKYWDNRVAQNLEVGIKTELGAKIDNRGHLKQDFCFHCSAWRGQLGLEPTIKLYLSHLLQITKEIWRVLKKDGVFFLNIGDSYWGGKGQSGQAWSTLHTDRDTLNKPYHQLTGMKETRPQDGKHETIKPKDLCLIPFRLALTLQAQGWWVRSDIIWAKPNPMPESVKDRPTRSHEYIFMLTKSQHYWWDQEAVKEKANYDGRTDERMKGSRKYEADILPIGKPQSVALRGYARWIFNDNGERVRNIRSVWTIATQPYPKAHYATFPEELVERCIKAGCPKGKVVLDPFAGSGTVETVAERLNRIGIGFDLGYENLRIKRIQNVQKEIFA